MLSVPELTSTVIDLISSSREGRYWDFKRQPHSNKACLVHDIICLANGMNHRGIRYLIIGVSDDGQVVGLEAGQKDRKQQSNLIDLLRSIPFSGDIRPVVEIHTLEISEKAVDVIVIEDRNEKPYVLSRDYDHQGKKLRAGAVYSRTVDTNTPINRTTDIFHVEKMWKQRFGLDQTPRERMLKLLEKPIDWVGDITGDNTEIHHDVFPEFQITRDHPESLDPKTESFCYFYPNHSAFYGKVDFRYHSTVLFETEYVFCDEMRVMMPVPKRALVGNRFFFYFNLDNHDGAFLNFLSPLGDYTSSGRGSAPICIFENDNELTRFIQYAALLLNKVSLDETDSPIVGDHSVPQEYRQAMIDQTRFQRLVFESKAGWEMNRGTENE